MPPSMSPAPLRVWTEQMLLAKIVTALGLALLLVVGAWSTSRGDADVHAALCLAPGVSAPAATAGAGAEHHDEVAAVDVLSSDAALCVIAVLCGVAFVLLLRRLLAGTRGVPAGRAPRAAHPVRAGPHRPAFALTLIQLSISRT